MMQHGFLRVAAATPVVRVGDPASNAERTLDLLRRAADDAVAVAVFPELGLTGYTCGDLFGQPVLLRAARQALLDLAMASADVYPGVAVVGLPLLVDDQLFNCAAVLHRGRVLGVVPKSYLPNYKEFYEARWFAPAAQARGADVVLGDRAVPFGTGLLFAATDVEGLVLGVEICEDLWGPVPPSSVQAQAGATLLVNLSASNDLIGKAGYRRQLVVSQSGRCVAAYVYASCGVHESTTDVVFGGHCLIAENGVLLEESPRFRREATLTIADVDLERLQVDRARTTSFGQGNLYQGDARIFATIDFTLGANAFRRPADDLRRKIDAHPFVPKGPERARELADRCEEIFHLQVAGLARRLEQIGTPPVAIGVSGGLDSTLALLVACKTMDVLGVPRSRIHGLTMPGFGTSPKTRGNAHDLMRQLGVASREIDIRPLCLAEMRALGHAPFGLPLDGDDVDSLTAKMRQVPRDARKDLTFENIQARMRTQLLMNTGFVVGTGDVSELALGWCTYNADHMSMYNPNVSIPKTLVKFLVVWAAENEFAGEVRATLLDIGNTVISPELLPTDADGTITQSTEEALGPYEVLDFFLFHFLRYSAPPAKILFLAGHAAFSRRYAPEDLRRWLAQFLRRFFANQFKRSALPDGPKVGSVSLSPRGDWRMPSDGHVEQWLRNLDDA